MIACFDIGGSFIKFGASTGDGLVPELGRVKTPGDDYEAFVEALRSSIAKMPGTAELVAISIAGFIDTETKKAVIANIPCINGRQLNPDLDERLGCPVMFINDADCFALAESGHGVGKGKPNVFAIILGSGLGGGLVIDGRLVVGHGGIAGEWGHSPIVDRTAGGLLETPLPDFTCGCGRHGCLDLFGGARGMERIHKALSGEALSSDAIVRAWRDGVAAAELTISVYVENIARALNLIVNTIGVDSVPVGGGLASAPDLIARIDKRVRDLALAHFAEPLVVPGTRASDGGLVGAALAGHQRMGATG